MEFKTLLCGGIAPPFPELAYKEHIKHIPGEYEFFEFPNPASVTIEYFREKLQNFLDSIEPHQKATIICLSGSASFVLQSKQIIEQTKNKIGGILMLHPIYSISDIPKHILRKQRLLEKLNIDTLTKLGVIYGINESELSKIVRLDISKMTETIRRKLGLLEISYKKTPYIEAPFPIVSVFTPDDYPIGNEDISILYFPQEMPNEVSLFFRNAVQESTLSPNYTPFFLDGVKHGELRRYPEAYGKIIQYFYEKIQGKEDELFGISDLLSL